MPIFRYRARDAQGRAVTGRAEGLSGEAVARQLGSGGMVPLEIVETAPPRASGAAFLESLGLGGPSRVDLILLTRQMYALSRAGVPITQALRRLASTSRNAVLGRTLSAMLEELEAGRDLARLAVDHEHAAPVGGENGVGGVGDEGLQALGLRRVALSPRRSPSSRARASAC